MHTVWKGSISFGLVNIPVRMFTATEERDIRFRQLHKECNTPIKYTKMCPHCQREVDASEIVRGYEYEKGHFVMINDEDLEAITPKPAELLRFSILWTCRRSIRFTLTKATFCLLRTQEKKRTPCFAPRWAKPEKSRLPR